MNWLPIAVISILVILATPRVLYLVLFNRRRKELVGYKIRRIVVGELALAIGTLIVYKAGHQSAIVSVVCGFVLALAVVGFISRPERRRSIPMHIKRAVIERDLKGERYDPSKHHIDHIVPYSMNGDHSIENLRVVLKTENLRRGARKPKLRELLERMGYRIA